MSSAAKRKMIAATMIGNVIEWYDFAIYGSFAASIGRDFFPREDAVTRHEADHGEAEGFNLAWSHACGRSYRTAISACHSVIRRIR